MTAAGALPAPRSTFVTVVAWIWIVLAGFTTFTALLQTVLVSLIFRGLPADKLPAGSDVALLAFFMTHPYLFFLAFFAVSAFTLAASIGLLLRRNWGRLAFVAMLGLGIAWNVAATVGMFFFLPFFKSMQRGPNPQGMDVFFYTFAGFNLLMAIGMSVLFGWIIKRLLSPEVRREFGR